MRHRMHGLRLWGRAHKKSPSVLRLNEPFIITRGQILSYVLKISRTPDLSGYTSLTALPNSIFNGTSPPRPDGQRRRLNITGSDIPPSLVARLRMREPRDAAGYFLLVKKPGPDPLLLYQSPFQALPIHRPRIISSARVLLKAAGSGSWADSARCAWPSTS